MDVPRLHRRRRLLLAALAAAAAVALACAGPPGGRPPGEDGEKVQDDRIPVEAAPAGRADVADQLVASGVVESEAAADVVPEASGVVREVRVEEGDPVRAGQVLAVLSSPSLEAAAERARAELDRAERAAEEARRLHAAGAISDRELREAETALAVARANRDEAARSLDFTRIRSPLDGTVAARDVHVGDLAGPGQRAFRVVDLAHLRVVLAVPERDLARLRPGQPVRLRGAFDDAAEARGRVDRVGPVVDPNTGTVRVIVEVEPPPAGAPPAVRPGQYVEARIEVDRREGVLAIPRSALSWVEGQPVAWVVEDAPPDEDAEEEEASGDGEEEDGPGWLARLLGRGGDDEEEPDPWAGVPRRVVHRRVLEVGYSDDRWVEVRSGLAEGELVVTAGVEALREAAPVKLPGDPAPAADADAEDGDGDGDG